MHGTMSGDPDPHVEAHVPRRDYRIDLARGLALWLIYLDHIPNNVFSQITPRNFGFSDAAEMFIFVSGLTCGLVYGKIARDDGLLTATGHAWRRSWQIYVATIFLIVAYAAEVSYLSGGRDNFLDDTNLGVLLRDPGTALQQALALRYAPVNVDALPLIIILHVALPLILVGLLKLPRLTLVASIALYALAHLFDWSISAYPKGSLYFNPLDWQLLFVIGVWCALGGLTAIGGILRSRVTIVICLLYLALSLSIVIGWQWPALRLPLPDAVETAIYPVDKSDLDVLRLLHFLALAAVAWRFIPNNHAALRARILLPIIRCGEYSLVTFCLGVLLAFAASVILTDVSGGLAMQLLVSAGGIVAMIAAATLLATADRTSSDHPRTI